MGEHLLHSLIPAADHRVDDVELMWSSITADRSHLADVSVPHVMGHESIREAGRELVTIGVRHSNSVSEVSRFPAASELSDPSRVGGIPSIFDGEI
jgi:hypothetical protein